MTGPSIRESVFFRNEKVVFIESMLLIVLVWAFLAHPMEMTNRISSPYYVAEETWALFHTDDWTVHLWATFRRTMYGFAVTIVVGTALGLAMGWSKVWEDAFKDYVTIGLALPSLFAAVFAAMWFGISDITPVVASALISFPFVTQGIYQGVKNIDMDLINMSNSFEVSRRRLIRRVVLESIMPEWFAGVRYAFAICWKITTLAEFIAASSGIGFMIATAMNQLALTTVLVWTVIFMIIIMIAEYGVFQQIEKRVFDWRTDESIGWV